MSEATITVRGAHRISVTPERAVVRLSVSLETARADAAQHGVTVAATAVADRVRALHDPSEGPVTAWSMGTLHTGSHRPWDKNGTQLPPVFVASTRLSITFSDFDVLSTFLADIASQDGVGIDGVAWLLTDERQEDLIAQARTEAVHDASSRARAYANAAGFTAVRLLELSEPGLMSREGPTGAYGGAAVARAVHGRAAPALEFEPEDVDVQASVEARFVAS
jgi:uncharacterized protein YggE